MSEEPQIQARRGLCLILSSPSGAGKTTLARMLLEGDPALAHSISVTTRPPRPQEKEGVDYFFISRDRFSEMCRAGDLLEWAEVFGNLYGTPKEYVQRTLGEGRDVVFDVEWHGAASIAGYFPEDTVRIFILPPSARELSRRINYRAADSKKAIEGRLKAAADEISHWSEYDYVLVNYKIDETLAILRAIVTAERYRKQRRLGLGEFAARLMRDCRLGGTRPQDA